MSEFSYNCDFPVEETVMQKTVVSEFENGFEQRRQKWANPLRSFNLVFSCRTKTEMENVRNFFTTKKGALTSFTWTNPNDSVEYTVRFKEDSFKYQQISYRIYDFELELIQVK